MHGADTGAALLWRVKADLTLQPLEFHRDGSYTSVLVNPKIRGGARQKLIDAARAGEDLDPARPAASGWSNTRSPTATATGKTRSSP